MLRMDYSAIFSKTNELLFYKSKIEKESVREDFYESFRERQLFTKEWLIKEISYFDMNLNRVLILGSWYGILQYEILKNYLDVWSIDYVDIDPYVHYIREEYLSKSRPDHIKHNSIEADAVDFCNQDISKDYDLIICTSLEHFKPFKTHQGPLYALIGNNKDIPDHINPINSVRQIEQDYGIGHKIFEHSIWDSHYFLTGFKY